MAQRQIRAKQLTVISREFLNSMLRGGRVHTTADMAAEAWALAEAWYDESPARYLPEED